MIDQDEIDDLRAEARAAKRQHSCQCGTDLYGTCPGPDNCQFSGNDDGEEE